MAPILLFCTLGRRFARRQAGRISSMTQFKGEERRRHRRFLATLLTESSGESHSAFGPVKDLSRSGLYVFTGARPEIGAVEDFSFSWSGKRVQCKVRVVRHSDDGIGVEFVDPSDKVLAGIERILEAWDKLPAE